jgi:Ca2+/Na+ antiporter
MGILVLAWGNSFGDLVADTRMSRSGFLNMAVFGVFAAHIQNVLFTLGTSFFIATLSASPNRGEVQVRQLDRKVLIGATIVFGIVTSSLVLVPTVFKYRLPKAIGWGLLAIYATFAVVTFICEFLP